MCAVDPDSPFAGTYLARALVSRQARGRGGLAAEHAEPAPLRQRSGTAPVVQNLNPMPTLVEKFSVVQSLQGGTP